MAYPMKMVRDESVMASVPASYAARLRSAGHYFAAAIVEQHLGERRGFDSQGGHLTERIAWRIPDDKRCDDHRLSRAYAGWA